MHPLIARFLALPVAAASLEKASNGGTLDAGETALAKAAEKFPKGKAAVLKAKGSKNPSQDAQQHLIVLATRAAVVQLNDHPLLGEKIRTTLAALTAEGAAPAEADDVIAQAVLEEAFGYAEDPESFDEPFLAETLDAWGPMSKVTQDTVDDWLEAFARKGSSAEQPLRLKVAELILESAWSEGPQPIGPEHLDEAMELVTETVAASELERSVAVMTEFLKELATRHVIGPLRLQRLEQLLRSATTQGLHPEEEEEELDDEA